MATTVNVVYFWICEITSKKLHLDLLYAEELGLHAHYKPITKR
jgi:hypothetical protein